MLVVLVAPVVGFGYLTSVRLTEARSHRSDVAEIRSTLESLIELRDIRSLVINEKHWDYATRTLDDLGVSRDLVIDLVGIDPWAERSAARSALDDMSDVADPEVLDEIAAIRADTNLAPVDASARYIQIEEQLGELTSDASNRLLELPVTPQLSSAVRVFNAVGTASDDNAQLLGNLFGMRFPSSLPNNENARQLISHNDAYNRTLTTLDEIVPPGSATAAQLDVIANDPDVSQFRSAIDATVTEIFGDDQITTEPIDLPFFADHDLTSELKETFLAAEAAVQQHHRAVDAAAQDVTEAAVELDATAATQARRAQALGVAVIAMAVVTAYLAVRSIVRPLRRISDVADHMRTHSLDTRADETGPRELRSAAKALNEAVDQLQLSERQALALARRDLDDPVLEMTIPGPLGRSLRDAVTQLTSSINEREDFRRRLVHATDHDVLTGLPNRTATIAHVERALGRAVRSGDTVALLVVDLDHFKLVNDTHGHTAGDRVLVEMARRLQASVRQGDVVGRVGADEFVVVAEPVADAAEAEQLAQRLISDVAQALSLAGTDISLGASIGISLSTERADADRLLHEASTAVAAAKRDGRGRIRFCDEDMRSRLASRSDVERGLIRAIEHDELVIHVQELVRACDEQPVSLEALVRWQHPERGMVPPGDFIPVAEESDLIVALDRWVLERSAAHLAEWSNDPARAHLSLAVNISERHLTHPALIDNVLGPLRLHGIDPRRLTVEVTETALLDDLATAASQLEVLRSAGIRVAIDDFGTGYTSLTHLRALPVDIVKIDRSFVANLHRDDERSLVRLIVEVGHLFGYEVVAEGVETAVEASELVSLGVDVLQGFHYSRPSLVELGPGTSAPRLQPAS
jgi:diguanylate cyclase (GGDEF)-like protein